MPFVAQVECISVEKRTLPYKHHVYILSVRWSNDVKHPIYRTYAAFFDFLACIKTEAATKEKLPELPGLKWFERGIKGSSKSSDAGIQKRRKYITDFCQSIIHLPRSTAREKTVHSFFDIWPSDFAQSRLSDGSGTLKGRPVSENLEGRASNLSEPGVRIRSSPHGSPRGSPRQEKHSPHTNKRHSVYDLLQSPPEVSIELMGNKHGRGKQGGNKRPATIETCGRVEGMPLGQVSPHSSTSLSSMSGHLRQPSVDAPESLYRVVANYNQQNPGEVTLPLGGAVDVLEKDLSGWWFVLVVDSQQQGWAPGAFLEPALSPIATSTSSIISSHPEPDQQSNIKDDSLNGLYKTTVAYKGQKSDEVSYEEGQIVEVLAAHMDGWWHVRCNGKVGYTPATHLQQLECKLKKKGLDATLGGGLYHQRSIYKKRNAPPRRQVSRVSVLVTSGNTDTTSSVSTKISTPKLPQLPDYQSMPKSSQLPSYQSIPTPPQVLDYQTPPGAPPGGPPCPAVQYTSPGAPVPQAVLPPQSTITQGMAMKQNSVEGLQYTEVVVGVDASEPRGGGGARPIMIINSNEPTVEYAEIVHNVQLPPSKCGDSQNKKPAHNYINIDLDKTALMMDKNDKNTKPLQTTQTDSVSTKPSTTPLQKTIDSTSTMPLQTTKTDSAAFKSTNPVSTTVTSPPPMTDSVKPRGHSDNQYINVNCSWTEPKKHDFYKATKEFIPGATQSQGLHVRKGDIVQAEMENPGQLFCVKCEKDANAMPQEGWVPRGALTKVDPKITGVTKHSVPMVKYTSRPPPLDLTDISSMDSPGNRRLAPVPPSPSDPSPRVPKSTISQFNNAADPVANSKIQAIFDYNSSADTVLSFKQGETAELIRKNPAGWWCVRISASRVGWVPQDYWKPISNRNHKASSDKKADKQSDSMKSGRTKQHHKSGDQIEYTTHTSMVPSKTSVTTQQQSSHPAFHPETVKPTVPLSQVQSSDRIDVTPEITKKSREIADKSEQSSGSSSEDKSPHGTLSTPVAARLSSNRSPKLSHVNVEQEPWYVGPVGRVECETLLKQLKQERGFLVRTSSQQVGGFTLSVFHHNKVRHFSIQPVSGGKYHIGGHDFKDVHRIINYYSSQPLFRDETDEGISLGEPISLH